MLSVFTGLMVGIFLVAAVAGPAVAAVRVSSFETTGVLEFTFDDAVVDAARSDAVTGDGG